MDHVCTTVMVERKVLKKGSVGKRTIIYLIAEADEASCVSPRDSKPNRRPKVSQHEGRGTWTLRPNTCDGNKTEPALGPERHASHTGGGASDARSIVSRMIARTRDSKLWTTEGRSYSSEM